MNEDSDNLPELPEGWVWAQLSDVGIYINGRAFKPSEWEEKGLRPIIRIQNLTGSTNIVNYYSGPIEEKHLVKNGDLLISWSATLDVFIWDGREAVLNQHIFKVIPKVDKTFLFYSVKAYLESLKRQVHGTGMQHITKGKFDNTPIPLPPSPEQHRIIAKIEELFAEVKTIRTSLEKVQPTIRRFRQSVLASAFRGELVPQNPDDELASVLLKRIQEKKKKKLGKKYKEPEPIDTDGLPELPEGWVWTTVDCVIDWVQYGTSDKASKKVTSLPVLRMNNIQEGQISYQDLKYLEPTKEYDSLLLEDNDLLFNRTNSPELVGKTAIFKRDNAPDKNVTFASYLIRIRPNIEGLHPILLTYFINSTNGRRYIERVRTQQVGQSNVNSTKLRQMPIPLPPLTEQHRIISKIEELFALADNIEQSIQKGKKRADYLEQSILAKAFRGELIPQDPNDEPASVLLERIKAEREKNKKSKRGRK